MRIELESILVYEAFDNQEWGSFWGYYTTEEEARSAVDKNQTRWTNGAVRKKFIEVPKDYDLTGNNF